MLVHEEICGFATHLQYESVCRASASVQRGGRAGGRVSALSHCTVQACLDHRGKSHAMVLAAAGVTGKPPVQH